MSETGLPPVVGPPAPPPPAAPQQVQIMLPPELQTVMQQFPEVVKRLTALEAAPKAAGWPTTTLVAGAAFLCGVGLMALLVFLWFYGAVVFRL